MSDKDIVTDYENLYRAYKKAKSGKRFNSNTARFQIMALDGIITLQKQLREQTYTMGKYNEFEIYEPKRRLIKSCSFKDKLVQHCFCDNILLPRLKDVFILDNCAGQIGKGTHFGMDRLKEHMMSHYQEYGLDGWILKCDIKKFFYSIDHENLKEIVDKYFPDEYTKWLNRVYIDSTDNPGLPLGNQVAQVHALLMLHEMDVSVVNDMGINRYGRYMDDFYLIHHNKEYLKECFAKLQEILNELKLEFNSKTQLVPFHKGIRYLGFHHYVTSDGKYIRKLTGENKRKIKRKLKRWSIAVKDGKMSEDKFIEKYSAWKNHAMHGNCIKLCQSMDAYVETLLGKEKLYGR